LGGSGAEDKIFLAADLSRGELESALARSIESSDEVEWDDGRQAVVARRVRRLGALVLEQQLLRDVPEAKKSEILLATLRKRGLAALPWTDDSRQWLARARLVGALCADTAAAARWGAPAQQWPDFSDQALQDQMQEWLGPFVSQLRSMAQLNSLNLTSMLQSRLTWEQNQLLGRLAPDKIEVPSGSRVRIDYCAGDVPVLAVRLQELFGARETPAVGEGKVPLLIHMLSPAGRPVQITRDLPGFWRGSYQEVRKDMKGRYPKHNWPEDPAAAAPHRGVRPKP
jgi:ATP-dependent helicase HrpB